MIKTKHRRLKIKELEEKLLSEHAEGLLAEFPKAKFYNLGWVSGKNFIHSKTSRGQLYSEIDPKTGEVEHTWTNHREEKISCRSLMNCLVRKLKIGRGHKDG